MVTAPSAIYPSRQETIRALRDDLQEELRARISRRTARAGTSEGDAFRSSFTGRGLPNCSLPSRSPLQAARLVGGEQATVQLGIGQPGAQHSSELPVVATGVRSFDQALPDGGVPFGAVTEIRVMGAGLATTLALAFCRSVHGQASAAMQSGVGRASWCAYVDPEALLFAPGVAAHGVRLEHLLVLQPEPNDIKKAAIMLAESHAFSLIVVDLRGHVGPRVRGRSTEPFRHMENREQMAKSGTLARLSPTCRTSSSGVVDNEQATIRRLSMAIRHVKTSIVLLTQQSPHQHMPVLPVALRLEVSTKQDSVHLLVSKDRLGRISSAPVPIPISEIRASSLRGVQGQRT